MAGESGSPAAPSGGAPSAPSGGGAQNLPSGGASQSSGSSAPTKTPTSTAKPADAQKGVTFDGGSLVDRLRRAAEGEKPERQPRIIKHKLETGDEIDVDISEHVAEALAAVQRRKLKVNGQEVEVDAEEAFERYPLARGAHEKFEEAAAMRKEVATFKEQLADLGKRLRSPDHLRDLLGNPKMLGPEKLLKFAESIVLDALAEEKMTPEQRASLQRQREIEEGARRRQAELDQREAKIKREEATRMEAETKRWSEHYAQAIPKLLEAVGVPHTPKSDKAWREAKKQALKLGLPVSDEAIAKEVANEYFADLEQVASKLPPDKLSRLLGENASKIGQAALETHRAPGSQVSVKGRETKPSIGGIPPHIKTPDQYRQWQYDQKVKARANR